MEKNIILIHSGLAVLLLLYLFLRLLLSLLGLRDREYQDKLRRRFRKADWCFAGIMALSGLYPILVLGQLELYHLIKLLLVGLFIWLSCYAVNFHFAAGSLVGVVLIVLAGTLSFLDRPVFPRSQGTFELGHPEIASMSELEAGALIFTTLCIKCHGDDGTKGRFGAADLSASGLSLEEKTALIKHGSPLTVMRSFSQELSDKEIEAVARYVHQFAQK